MTLDFQCITDLKSTGCSTYHECANICMLPVLPDSTTLGAETQANGNIDFIPDCYLVTTDNFDKEKFDVNTVKCQNFRVKPNTAKGDEDDDLFKLFRAFQVENLERSGNAWELGTGSEQAYTLDEKGNYVFQEREANFCESIDMVQTLNFRNYPTLDTINPDKNKKFLKQNPALEKAQHVLPEGTAYNVNFGIISNFGDYINYNEDFTNNKSAITALYSTGFDNDKDSIGELQLIKNFVGKRIGFDTKGIYLGGQFAKNFCYAHGCLFDDSVEISYTYSDETGDNAEKYEFGLPYDNFEIDENYFAGSANPCKTFSQDSNSSSALQIGIVLATAFYALLI